MAAVLLNGLAVTALAVTALVARDGSTGWRVARIASVLMLILLAAW